MRWRYITHVVGILLLFLGLSMAIPMLCSLFYEDGSLVPVCEAMVITFLTGLVLVFASRRPDVDFIRQREGMAIAALGWVSIGFFGALPFYLDGAFLSFTDAFFEAVSGFTTTGSTVLTDIESVSKSLLFWRSLIQWLGGMGIIVLSLAILPFLGVGGMQLFKAEVPSPVPDKLSPRLSDTAKILWYVYTLITILEVIFLYAGGMSFYDALCHAFTTMPTGGFSPKNASIAYYDSAYFDWVIIFFMMLAGINFSLHFQLLRGKTLIFWKDSEARFFLSLILLLILVVTVNVQDMYESLSEAVRYASFQVVAILTTTGYATADYELWPGLSQMILFLAMFVGGSAGSTAGGMKCARIMACFKYCYRELFMLIHPRSVSKIRANSMVIQDNVMRSIMGFLALYIALFLIASLLLAGLGLDMVSAFAASAACVGNIGPGFGSVGPVDNFAHIPAAGKWILAWCMLLGRLEIYTVIILFVPEFWKR